MKHLSAQIHARNMRTLKNTKDSFNIPRIRFSNKRKAKKSINKLAVSFYIFLTSIVCFGVVAKIYFDMGAEMTAYAINGPISPVPKPTPLPVIETIKVKDENIDTWVDESITRYFKPQLKSEMKMIMHCLLNRESRHGENQGHGDGGKAGGPLQFWQGTWNSYRGEMIAEGLTKEIGSRDDMQQAIDTTVWAISKGKGYAWGPILRDSNNNHYQSCPTPSWY